MKIEELKQKMKNEYADRIEEYFSQYEELTTSGNMNINSIEKLIGNGIAAAKEVIISTTEEMIRPKADNESGPESKKKHVRAVEKG